MDRMLHAAHKDTVAQSYLPRLDGLRAIAILLVLAQHFSRLDLPVGSDGVAIFFVISGYLITSILMSYSDRLSVADAARIFYWRRMLRLAPIYYLCLAVTAALGLGGMRQTWLGNALYLTNFRIALQGFWDGSGHFWTLSVEEQFYLLWFMIVMLVRRRFLPAIMLFFVCAAPLYRWVTEEGGNSVASTVLLPGVIDSMAAGALISYATKFSMANPAWKKFQEFRIAALLASLGAMIVTQAQGAYLHCIVNIFAACLVSLAIETESHWTLDWLGGRTIRHLGKISYGIYVFHYFIPTVVDAHWKFEWTRDHDVNVLARFVVLATLSVALAEISWRLIETPISRFKTWIPVADGLRTTSAGTSPGSV
jgi:peptidoglycan/LPS O-acetylase OafA/YrhL